MSERVELDAILNAAEIEAEVRNFKKWWPSVGQAIGEVAARLAWLARAASAKQAVYHEAVAAEVSRQTKWPIDQARRFIGDPEDMTEAMLDDMPAADYAEEILAAAAESQ